MAGILEAFVLLFGVIDPLASLAAFLSLTKKADERERIRIALKAVGVAAAVFFIFAIAGQPILDLLGVGIPSFRAAGGIVLILLGIQMSMGIAFPKEKDEVHEVAVVIGTPMISGPATISATVMLAGENGVPATAIAGAAVLLITLAMLAFSGTLTKIIGRGGLKVASSLMGIIMMAWGLQFFINGINSLGTG
ncbi:MAG: MarC family protein [Candidatus Micrarchaeota archaeon]